jgi:hypothetical protein
MRGGKDIFLNWHDSELFSSPRGNRVAKISFSLFLVSGRYAVFIRACA